ncbi:hypothetical protein BJ742DRAFT_765499 [Cladochytrium replicatum]|nr:hypothetical protein BJ742DRAFT_765499 [Cladochytrium replicatum]
MYDSAVLARVSQKPEEQPIRELATNAPDRETKTSKIPVSMSVVFLCAMTAGVVPSLVTVLNTAQSSIDDMTSQIVMTSTLSAATALVQQLNQVTQLTTILADTPMVDRFLSTRLYNYGDNAELNLQIDRIRSQSLGPIGCTQRQDLLGNV